MPSIELAMSASGPSGVTYEYSYGTSVTGWSAWSESPYAVLEHGSLCCTREGDRRLAIVATLLAIAAVGLRRRRARRPIER